MTSDTPYIDFSVPYFEPFCGSASLFFLYGPSRGFLNDLNGKLIWFYKQIIENPDQVWGWYTQQEVCEENYYRIRQAFNESDNSSESAGMFLYLNHFGFNGIYRTNTRGELNTPFGAKTKPKRKISSDEIKWYSRRLANVSLSNLDFEEAIDEVSPAGFSIYFDPPYHTVEDRVFKEYGASAFSAADLERLKELAIKYSKKNQIVISYRDCNEFRDLFGNFIAGTQSVTRNVGGFQASRKQEIELIAVLGA